MLPTPQTPCHPRPLPPWPGKKVRCFEVLLHVSPGSEVPSLGLGPLWEYEGHCRGEGTAPEVQVSLWPFVSEHGGGMGLLCLPR